jgi:hypothetical protein
MQVLFYAPSGDQDGDRLQRNLDETFPRGNVETHRTLTGLIQGLRNRNADLKVVLLMPENRLELSGVYTLLDELRDVRLVLVLPDGEDETIAMAHRLRPRFVTYANGDYSGLRQVLQKMLKKNE